MNQFVVNEDGRGRGKACEGLPLCHRQDCGRRAAPDEYGTKARRMQGVKIVPERQGAVAVISCYSKSIPEFTLVVFSGRLLFVI